jgi:hypothetical protein
MPVEMLLAGDKGLIACSVIGLVIFYFFSLELIGKIPVGEPL